MNKEQYLSSVFDVSDCCILITGASSGFGAHFANLFLSCGCEKIALIARRLENLQNLKSSLVSKFPAAKIYIQKFDVSDTKSIPILFDNIEENLGTRVTTLINNAGVSIPRTVLNFKEEDYDKLMNINLKACFFFSQEFGRRAKNEKGNRSVINISSLSSFRPIFGEAVYSITKGALNHLTRSIQKEWFRYGIRVNTICPGYFETEINEDFTASEEGKKTFERMYLKRTGQLDELSGSVLLLASKAGSYMYAEDITVDGGEHLAKL
eukprot:snap_masked-scaffold_4-processed-gene-3.29-mRNA-1 protein AED:0.01 eAED:0.01 QI:0/-1/0/1/-1/1/1/0/265